MSLQDGQIDPQVDEIADPAPLALWSRIVSGMLGFLLCGAGSAAVFMTENQAGSVALILAGALFIILTIGGNPLHSMGFGDTQMRFAVQRRRQQVLESVSHAPPEEARRTLEVLQTIDPGVVEDAGFRYQSARAFEGLIKQRFMQLFPDCTIATEAPYGHVDFIVARPVHRFLSVDALFLEQVSPHGISRASIVKRVRNFADSVVPLIIVSNVPMSHGAQRDLESAQASGTHARFVQWRDERDDRDLYAAAEDLFRIPSAGTSQPPVSP
ncbi:hypothetical protein [Streptomyces virginiae]|uniref:hypothetical protein n=1 Tax=Streptomyces virginiae TaxID=1961 RepID=UPI0032512042